MPEDTIFKTILFQCDTCSEMEVIYMTAGKADILDAVEGLSSR